MTTDIFIRTYHKDIPWLEYCLRSIAKYCTGFNEIVITIPNEQKHHLAHLTRERVVGVHESYEGYLCQQEAKMRADEYCQADSILYVDSDCCFTSSTTPMDFMRDDKPYLLKTAYSTLGDTVPWKPITEKALGFECKYECMRRVPTLFLKNTVVAARQHVEQLHGVPISQYIACQPHRSFSEFNCIGAYADKFQNDLYAVIDTEKDPLPPLKAVQRWSWGGITEDIRKQLEMDTA